MTLVIGDLNTQISSSRPGLEHVIGPHGAAQWTNDNGERLLLFCNVIGLCVSNTYFPHKNIHKQTWRSPNGLIYNEINYICVSKRWSSTVQDVRTYRGADVGSDHYLVKATLKLNLKRKRHQATEKPFAVEKLKTASVTEQFQLKVTNRFQQLQHATDIEEQWTMFKQAVTQSAEETLGHRCGSQRERWIRDKTCSLIDERKLAKHHREQAKTPQEKRRNDW